MTALQFITFEGGDATGKSTQVRRLCAYLRSQGREAVAVAEPGGTALGRRVRRLVKYGRMPISPLAEAMLFLAARAQLCQEVIAPAVERGAVVVSDRFADSTLAYQGYGRGLDVAELRRLNAAVTGGLEPGVTVLLDVPVDVAMTRRRRTGRDRFEAALQQADAGDVAFHLRVREGYLSLARESPERWLVLDATQPRAAVGRRVQERVAALL